jgi:CheY-like chemotaxis protein
MSDCPAHASRDHDKSLSGTVLVVDDNKEGAEQVLKQLEQLGLKAEAVFSGQSALDCFKGKLFDCVLIDLQMPGMDGFATGRQMRFLEVSRHIPIIAVSSGESSENKRQCLDAGMDDYLPRPVSTRRLREILGKWLSSGKSGEDC